MRGRSGNIILPVMVTVVLGAGVAVMNTFVARSNFKKIDNRTFELIAFPEAEIAAWKSFYYTGAPGSVDSSGRFAVSLENDYSTNLPALPTTFPSNYSDGTPLNVAQTMPYDPGRAILSRVTNENFRYSPIENVPSGSRNCGYLGAYSKNSGFQSCLVKNVPPPVCSPGVCSAAIETCIATVEPKTPIKITTEDELLAIQSGNHYQLANDITMTKVAQITQLNLANIVLEGKGFKIKQLASRNAGKEELGLFHALSCSVVKDLKIEGAVIANSLLFRTGGYLAQTLDKTGLINIDVTGSFYIANDYSFTAPTLPRPPGVGGLVGLATNSIFKNINVMSSLLSTGSNMFTAGVGPLGATWGDSYYVGGIVSELKGTDSRLTDVKFGGTISASGLIMMGGLVSSFREGTEILRGEVSGTLQGIGAGGSLSTGGLVFSMGDVAIRESTFSGSITGAYGSGGIATYLSPTSSGIIEKSKFTGTISATGDVGGIVGSLAPPATVTSAILSQNLSAGTINAITYTASGGITVPLGRGGIAGLVSCTNGCQINNCLSSTTFNLPGITMNRPLIYMGGLVGRVPTSPTKLTIKNSLSIGHLACTGCGRLGAGVGFVGTAAGIQVTTTDSFFDPASTGVATSAGGVISKTTTELQNSTTYSNWDIGTIWNMNVGSYPSLILP